MLRLVQWNVFVAVLIEHTAGKFPLWLTPDQVAILPISEKFNDYADKVRMELKKYDVRALVDDRNEKIGRKIRDNEMKRIPYMLIVGEKEAENGEVAVRKQGEGDKGTMKIEEFAKNIAEEVHNMINKMGKFCSRLLTESKFLRQTDFKINNL